MLSLIKADLKRYLDPALPYEEINWEWRSQWRQIVRLPFLQGVWAGLDYRLRQWENTHLGRPGQIYRAFGVISQRLIEILTGISISGCAKIGPGLYIGHFGEIIVGADVRIGANCNLSQGVTLGIHKGGLPELGDRVYVGPGAKVFGAIKVGDDVKIGANAVVYKDVPAEHIVVTAPGQIMSSPKRTQENT